MRVSGILKSIPITLTINAAAIRVAAPAAKDWPFLFTGIPPFPLSYWTANRFMTIQKRFESETGCRTRRNAVQKKPGQNVSILPRPSDAALAASYQNGENYSLIAITTPEPTVLPPSRIAKRRPCSMAMGVISSTSISMLSPGMHISTPSGRAITPVTSVVLK